MVSPPQYYLAIFALHVLIQYKNPHILSKLEFDNIDIILEFVLVTCEIAESWHVSLKLLHSESDYEEELLWDQCLVL